jgi:hypothetical protein
MRIVRCPGVGVGSGRRRLKECLSMKKWLLACACAFSLLGGCGGGGGDAPAPVAPPAADPLIRYAAQYRYLGLPNERLTISPVTGESAISARGLGSVEVRANGVLLPALTAPNATDASGRGAFVFDLPRAAFAPAGVGCTAPMRLEIGVTDAQGFRFNRYVVTPCRETDFGGFSDWGNRSLTFRIAATTPVDGSFGHIPLAGMEAANSGRTVPGERSKTWDAVPAREGDQAFVTATIPQDAPDDAQVEVSIESNGVVLARSRATKASLGRTANVSVVCCQGSAPSPTTMRTVQMVLFPAGTSGVNQSPVPYNLRYRVFDPAAQRVLHEFAGTPPGPAAGTPDVYTFSVRPGDELTLEASPLRAGETVDMYILAPSEGVARELGSIVHATVPNEPSLLRVFCCSR